MNLTPRSSRPTKSVLAALLLVAIAALAIGWSAGTVAASSGSHIASPPATAVEVSGVTLGAPSVGTTNIGPQNAAGTTSSGLASSIAYPFPGYNSLGGAPAGTILASGTGTADMKADGSDRAAALKKASDAALADARTQALAAAASIGVQLQGIYSVSISSSTNYNYPTSDCVFAPAAPGSNAGATGSAGVTPAGSPVVCSGVPQSTPTWAQLVVTLIVAYKYA